MQIIRLGTDNPEMPPSVAAIGFFDGVHLGHRHLITRMIRMGEERGGLRPLVVTFEEHPRQALHKDFHQPLLTTNEEKIALLDEAGVGCCAMLRFDADMAAMSAREFMEKVLRKRLNVRCLLIGYDHRFGHNRSEDFNDYACYGQELGIDVVRADALTLNGAMVSSSAVRSCLAEGLVVKANAYLGYKYFVSGRVVDGFQEGRKIGFPTANIEANCADKVIPMRGVYAVKVRLEDGGRLFNGMMDIGTRPTFGGEKVTLEVNILDFSGDIYGQTVTVEFCKRLRDERKFGSLEELAEQLKSDRQEVERLFS